MAAARSAAIFQLAHQVHLHLKTLSRLRLEVGLDRFRTPDGRFLKSCGRPPKNLLWPPSLALRYEQVLARAEKRDDRIERPKKCRYAQTHVFKIPTAICSLLLAELAGT